MKKHLGIFIIVFTIAHGAIAQTLSPFWNTVQNTSFTITSAAIDFMDAVDQNVLWATGNDNSALSKNYNWFTTTSNGGVSYTSGSIFPDTNTFILCNMEGIDANNAWVAACYKSTLDKGVLYHTNNGGVTWTNGGTANMFSVTATSFVDFVSFLTPSVGIAVGDPVGGDFEIYRTTDGGTTWAAVAGSLIPNSQASEYGIGNVYTKYGSNDIWFGTSKNRIYHSSNGGQNWSVSAAMTSTIGAANSIRDIAFRDPNNGLACAFFGSGNTPTLWKTINGGVTWTQIPILDPNYGIWDMCSIPGTTWYASCGLNGSFTNIQISYSTDDGVTWNNWGGSGITYYKIDFVNNSVGWSGGVSSPTVTGQGGMYKYSGLPLAIQNTSNSALSTFECYPNPSSGLITIRLNQVKENSTIYVTDVLGKLVHNEIFNGSSIGEHVLNLKHLSKGIYYITLIAGREKFIHRLVIE
jgi:hypothetical protein